METVDYLAATSAPTTESTEVLQVSRPYPERGIIVIRAENAKTQQGLTARPCEDRTGKVFTGQGPTGHYETLSQDDKKSMNYVITPETEVKLVNDKTFDLDNNPIDIANWVWLRRHPYLALNKDLCKSSRDAKFYVDDPITEASRRVTESRSRDKARYIIQYTASKDQLIKAALLLGNLGANVMELGVLQDWLLQQADVIPDAILNVLEPKNVERTNAMLMLVELKKRKLVQRGDAGQFRFGGASAMPLGITDETVVDFMIDPRNMEAVQMMESALTQAKHS